MLFLWRLVIYGILFWRTTSPVGVRFVSYRYVRDVTRGVFGAGLFGFHFRF